VSKGMGTVQRDVLDLLSGNADQLYDSVEIACIVYSVECCTEAQHVSARRALRGLVERGQVVDLGRRGWRNGRSRWTTVDGAKAYLARASAAFGDDADVPGARAARARLSSSRERP
jgi:hypothetical protein